MSDAALREVLRSPLDDRPPVRRGGWAVLAAVVAAAAAGFGLTAGIRALTGAAPATTTAATTTTEAPPALAGPTALAEVGAEALAAWRQGGHLYVIVVTTVLPGQEPAEVAGVPSAHWVLRLAGGDLAAATAEMSTPNAPGIFTLEFPDVGLAPEAELLAYPAEQTLERTFTTVRTVARLPWEGPLDGEGGVLGAPYRLGGQEIAFSRVRLDDGGGELAWYLPGDSAARAVVTASATYTETGGGPQAIVAEWDLPIGYLVAAADSIPASREGGIHLFHLDDVDAPSYRSRFFGDPERVVDIEDLSMQVVVRLYLYGAEPAVLPLDPAVADG